MGPSLEQPRAPDMSTPSLRASQGPQFCLSPAPGSLQESLISGDACTCSFHPCLVPEDQLLHVGSASSHTAWAPQVSHPSPQAVWWSMGSRLEMEPCWCTVGTMWVFGSASTHSSLLLPHPWRQTHSRQGFAVSQCWPALQAQTVRSRSTSPLSQSQVDACGAWGVGGQAYSTALAGC